MPKQKKTKRDSLSQAKKIKRVTKDELRKKYKKTRLFKHLLLDDRYYTEQKNPLPTTKVWTEVKTTNGTAVRLPADRFVTAFTFTNTKWTQKLSLAKQGPHTIAHVFMDQLFAEAIKNETIRELKNVFQNRVPNPEIMLRVLEQEVNLDALDSNHRWEYQRYITYYTELYAAIDQMLTQPAPDIELLKLNIRAIMELHTYATYSWKSTGTARSSLAGKAERSIDLNSANKDNIVSLIDGLNAATFTNKEALNSFIANRLGMYFTNAQLRKWGFIN